MNEGHLAILVGLVPILGMLWGIMIFIRRLEKKLDFYTVEHEILIQWYLKENGKHIEDLPTRSRRIHT